MGAATVDLLPVSGAALSADPRALAAVRTVGTRHGVDLSDVPERPNGRGKRHREPAS
ncbi:hypothetical protein [Streptomyces olivaceus]|uniref:hypothetical protein n=1 Tax=Streptomyces olivaceus TaxID=47716 RepID=UPI001CCA7FCA|nr:hypothetical protein [Streptomyces olivaceus]MBZ6228590.1 hypothetical protein [Streptomyces olivaceus]